jgi:long-subunit fatty acid transport protein
VGAPFSTWSLPPRRRSLIRYGKILGFSVALAIAAGGATAQETPATFEFSFSNPRARSLGLGGAFAGMADDATAAFANPAGLVQLLRPEVSVEGRYWSYSTPYTEGGRFEGDPTGLGLDTTPGLRTGRSTEDVSGLSFLSFVYPSGNWSLAVYRHQLAKFRARTETQGLFHMLWPYDARDLDRRWFTDLDVVSYGISGALRIHDRLSLGLGLVYFDGRLDAPFEWYIGDDESLEGIFGPNSFLPEHRYLDGDMAFDDTDWGFNAGLLWILSEQWSAGGFYRQGPEFDLSFDVLTGPFLETLDPSVAEGTLVLGVIGPFSLPDVYGLGVSFRSRDGRWSVGFEWDRVEYSTMFDSFEGTVVGGIDEDADLEVQLAADDADELHLGAEYAFLESKPVIALRLGVWLDPDHRFHSTETGTGDDDLLHRALFPSGDDEIHVSVGVGLAFTRFQLDIGADFSDLVDTVSLSVIYSF